MAAADLPDGRHSDRRAAAARPASRCMAGRRCRERVAHAAIIFLAALLALVPCALATPKFPVLTGRVVDNAGLLTPQLREQLTTELAAIEAKSTDQVVVVTVPSLDGYAIEDYGYQLGRTWGIGQQGKDNGVILLVAPNERKVRIEVGRGLEPTMTDIMSKLIIENAILPAFRRGDFAAGITAGVRDIKVVLLGDAEAVKERAKGGGAGPGMDYEALIVILVWLLIVAYILHAQYKAARQAPRARRGRRSRWGDDGRVIIVPGGSGHWGGGWSGGGGGWSGGGGSFGGGGASGGW